MRTIIIFLCKNENKQRTKQQQRAKQQLTVLRALSEADGPLSARELWSRLSGSGESVGLATVYRALQRGVDEGTLEPVEVLGSGVRYEPKDREHHHHFLCSTCDTRSTSSVASEGLGPCSRRVSDEGTRGGVARNCDACAMRDDGDFDVAIPVSHAATE